MRRPTRLQLQLARLLKPESQAHVRARVNRSIRRYNQSGINLNWLYQASAKL